MPEIGESDYFEQRYMAKLEMLVAEHGLLIHYKADRAALDLGVHLFRFSSSPKRELSDVRVWFQAKGLQGSTISDSEFGRLTELSITGLKVDHVAYWYAAPEPVYLVVYVESVDRFLAEDVRDIVDRSGGLEAVTDLLTKGQVATTLRIDTSATLQLAMSRMPRHRSMRIDGPPFRGRPLGHRFDPLRSELAPLSPADFTDLVRKLMAAHDFRETGQIPIHHALGLKAGEAVAWTGKLHLTYEWTNPLFTEFGVGPDSDFRDESPAEQWHGDVSVVVHSNPVTQPSKTPASSKLAQDLRAAGIRRVLVFYNASDWNGTLFGGWRAALDPLARAPQGLGSLAFNVLTTTLVYLDFADRLEWQSVNYL